FESGGHFPRDVAANLFAEGLDVGVHPGVLVQLRQHGISVQMRSYSVTTQAPPRPRLCCRPRRAPSTWRLSAWPRNCWASSGHCARPVAPSGWPLLSRPPEGFVTTLPP